MKFGEGGLYCGPACVRYGDEGGGDAGVGSNLSVEGVLGVRYGDIDCPGECGAASSDSHLGVVCGS